MSLADELEKQWGLEPKKKPQKAIKEKQKTIVVSDESFDDPYDSELHEKATIAKLEQEISKAETMKYKAEQERLKLKRSAGEVMEFEKGDMLFFGFMEKCSIEILRVMDKFEPVIKNLTAENDYKAIVLTVNRELENILVNIQEEQETAVSMWQKGLK